MLAIGCARYQVSPRRALLAAPKEERPTSELRPVELPRLARPKGCFAAHGGGSIDELSGRTTGRLGYIRPTTAHAIGGTAELALRYSYHVQVICLTYKDWVNLGRLPESMSDQLNSRGQWPYLSMKGPPLRINLFESSNILAIVHYS